MRTFYQLLADAILVLHVVIVVFNVAALPVIWFGRFCGWSFVRSFSFRITHLLLIAFIAAESLIGEICPLTTWEDQLRMKAGIDPRYQGGFIAHWLHRLLFYDCDVRFFTAGYVAFFVLVLLTLVLVKPRAPTRWLAKSNRQ